MVNFRKYATFYFQITYNESVNRCFTKKRQGDVE